MLGGPAQPTDAEARGVERRDGPSLLAREKAQLPEFSHTMPSQEEAFATLRERFPDKSDEEIRAAITAASKTKPPAKKVKSKVGSKKPPSPAVAPDEPAAAPTTAMTGTAAIVDVADASQGAPSTDAETEWKQIRGGLDLANKACKVTKREIGEFMKKKETPPPELFAQKAAQEAEIKRLEACFKALTPPSASAIPQPSAPTSEVQPPAQPPAAPPKPPEPVAVAPSTSGAAALVPPAATAPSAPTLRTSVVTPATPVTSGTAPARNASGSRTLNINVGVLGHVDSGKTSLTRALSTVGSTAAFDKHPQSKERGITLDLGFSSFMMDLPEHLKDEPVRRVKMRPHAL